MVDKACMVLKENRIMTKKKKEAIELWIRSEEQKLKDRNQRNQKGLQ